MIDQQSTLFKVFKALSYLSLATVLGGLTTVFLLAIYESCTQLDFEGVVCADPTNQMLGEYGIAILWASVYTVAPAVLALAGAYFGVVRMMKVEEERLKSKNKPEQLKSKKS
jgi:hypothetical protein